jgi:hypothetical protein
MANVQAAIEAYVSTLVDIAELIPGWGQAITAARIVATIGEFWSEGTYKEMLQVINGDTASADPFLATMDGLLKHPAVQDCKTSFMLRRLKGATAVPL